MKEAILESVEGGEVVESMRGSYRANLSSGQPLTGEPAAPTTWDLEQEVEKAFATIEKYVKVGYRFSNRQREVAIETFLHFLTPTEISWAREISFSITRRPLWQCFLGWFRYCHENGVAQAPLFDAGWTDRAIKEGPEQIECALPECKKLFVPKRYGELYHSNECGAAADKERIREIMAKRTGGNRQIF